MPPFSQTATVGVSAARKNADNLIGRLAREDHMGDKQKVLQDAAEAYGELREAVAGLDEAQTRAVWLGIWGVNEILIHISGWDREIAPAFARIERGEPAYPAGAYDDFDAWNARFVEAGKHAQSAEVLADLEASHRGLVAAAGALGDEHFAPGAAARELLDGTGAQHYREHAAQIREWRNSTH
jgi:Protein of unknown function (DUF1706)